MDYNKLAAKQLVDIELDIEVEEAFEYESTLSEAINLIEAYKAQDSMNKVKIIKELEFKSDKWVLWNVITGHNEVMDFNKVIISLNFVSHIELNIFKNILKCWVLQRLVKDELSPTSVETYFNNLSEIVIRTQAFRKDNAEYLIEYIESLNLADGPKRQKVVSALNFLSYYNEIDSDFEYTHRLYQILNNLKADKKTRPIPPALDILKFSSILESFFETKNKTSTQYIHFFPLLLWWKITTIIPLRPFEFCRLDVECLKYENNKCYLLLPRLKGPHKKTKRSRNQVIDRISIPAHIESLLKEYKEIIKPYKHDDRKTLISRLVYEKTLISPKKGLRKRDNERFLTPDLALLIERFYREIIQKEHGLTFVNLPPIGKKPEKEKDNGHYDILMVRSIDSRHIAFINMLAQGWSKPEIARFGGHLVLETQEGYQNHREYWIEEETQKMMQKFRLGIKENISIKDTENPNREQNNGLALSMRLDARFKRKFILRPPSTNTARELKLGYCTDPLQNCKTHCLHCDFWRISQKEFHEKKEELYSFIKECDNQIHELFGFLNDLQRFVFHGELNADVADKILSTQKQIDDQIFKRSSMLFNLEKSNVGG